MCCSMESGGAQIQVKLAHEFARDLGRVHRRQQCGQLRAAYQQAGSVEGEARACPYTTVKFQMNYFIILNFGRVAGN